MNDWFEAEQRVERAQEYYESGRWEEALRELREAIRVNPDNGEWHFNLGLTLDALGRLDEAIESFDTAIDLQGEDVEALNVLGCALSRKGEHDRALRCFDRAEEVDPSDPASYANRIGTFAELKRFDDAETMFYLAMQIDSTHARAYYNMGQCQLEQNQYDKALYCFEQVRKLDDSDDSIHGRLADAHWAKGDLEQAYRSFIRQLRRQPGDIDALIDLGNLLIEMSRPLEAAEKFRRVIELEPTNAEAHHFLGELAMRANHEAAALGALERALKLNDKLPGVRTKLAAILLNSGHPGRAKKLLRDEIALDDPSVDDRFRDELGQLLLDAEMPAEAEDVYRSLTGRLGSDPRLFNQLAVAVLRQGKRAEGTAALRKAVRLDRQYTLALFNLATVFAEDGNLRRAQAVARRGARAGAADPRLAKLLRTIRRRRFIRRWLSL